MEVDTRLKVCSKCGQNKPLDDFYKDIGSRDGHLTYCKKCVSVYGKRHYKENKERINKRQREYYYSNKDKEEYKEKRRCYQLEKENGMAVSEYRKLFEAQKGVCAICGLAETVKNRGGIRNLAVDHNHKTGKKRGLLCTKCNTALGLLDTDNLGIELLLSAISYIKNNE